VFDATLAQIRANPRLRLGLWLILLILWVYGILLLDERRDADREEYARLDLKVRRAALDSEAQGWIPQAERLRVLRTNLESQVWQAPSPSLARATYQDWLNRMFSDGGATRLQLAVTLVEDRPPESADAATARSEGATPANRRPRDLWQVRGKASFDFTPQSLLKVLTLLSENDRRNVIEALVVRRDPVPRVELTVSASFQKNDAAAPAASPPAPQQGKI
jgi:hypothetical protein